MLKLKYTKGNQVKFIKEGRLNQIAEIEAAGFIPAETEKLETELTQIDGE